MVSRPNHASSLPPSKPILSMFIFLRCKSDQSIPLTFPLSLKPSMTHHCLRMNSRLLIGTCRHRLPSCLSVLAFSPLWIWFDSNLFFYLWPLHMLFPLPGIYFPLISFPSQLSLYCCPVVVIHLKHHFHLLPTHQDWRNALISVSILSFLFPNI